MGFKKSGGSRPGARGGRDQFNWEQVKGDKYKENYLGQSLHLKPSWGDTVVSKGSTLQKEQIKDDIAAVKKQEQAMLLEALGLKPKENRPSGKILEQHEMAELCKRGESDHEIFTKEMRVAGLGYAPAPKHAMSANLTSSATGYGSILENSDMVHVPSEQNEKDKDKSEGKEKKDKHKKHKDKDKSHKKHKDKGHKKHHHKDKDEKRDHKDKKEKHRKDRDYSDRHDDRDRDEKRRRLN